MSMSMSSTTRAVPGLHQLDKNNHVIGTVWPGKSDLYHAFQSTLIPFLDPAVSIATAVKNAE